MATKASKLGSAQSFFKSALFFIDFCFKGIEAHRIICFIYSVDSVAAQIKKVFLTSINLLFGSGTKFAKGSAIWQS